MEGNHNKNAASLRKTFFQFNTTFEVQSLQFSNQLAKFRSREATTNKA